MARGMALVVALVGMSMVLTSPVAQAQETPPTVITAPHIIPRPNSGRAPAEAGDRGGGLQLLILGVLVVGVGAAAAHLVRESRRSRSDTPPTGP